MAAERPARIATLVLMRGLPGTGRGDLATRLAREHGWALLTKDAVTHSLAEVEVAHKLAAYTVMFGLAGLNLSNGMSVVLDAAFSLPRTRTQARKVAQAHGASFAAISCLCSDTDRWRRQLAMKPPPVEGWASPVFVSPEHIQKRYYPWRGPHLPLDIVGSLDGCYEQIIAYLDRVQAMDAETGEADE
jgi:predicted kinase